MELLENITHKLDHFGLLKKFMDEIGVIDTIDRCIPKPKRKVSIGNATAAMILNGMGFTGRALYLTPEFYENLPTSHFFGEGISAEDFNDDSLGSALDALYEYGVTELFYIVSKKALETEGIDQRFLHLDSSTFSFEGSYDNETTDDRVVRVNHGYSKDKRQDLKQVVLQMMTTYKSSIPAWMEVLDGNSSDKSSFAQSVKSFKSQLSAQEQMPIIVADSALYSKNSIAVLDDVSWITRVPETNKEAKQAIESCAVDRMQQVSDDYAIYPMKSTYGDVAQRWLIVNSTLARENQMKTFKRNLEKVAAQDTNALWHLSNQAFSCEADAHKEAERFAKKLKYHTVSYRLISRPHYEGRGRPAANATPSYYQYFIEGELAVDEAKIASATQRKGFFIIATNVLDELELPDEKMLSVYKAQGVSVERGFRFLKDPLFYAESLYLKSEKRIMALLMVMTLSLLVYSLAEKRIRAALKKAGLTVRTQVKKQTDNPTLKWVFVLMAGAQFQRITLEDRTVIPISTLRKDQKTILKALGPPFEKYYFLF